MRAEITFVVEIDDNLIDSYDISTDAGEEMDEEAVAEAVNADFSGNPEAFMSYIVANGRQVENVNVEIV